MILHHTMHYLEQSFDRNSWTVKNSLFPPTVIAKKTKKNQNCTNFAFVFVFSLSDHAPIGSTGLERIDAYACQSAVHLQPKIVIPFSDRTLAVMLFYQNSKDHFPNNFYNTTCAAWSVDTTGNSKPWY